MSMTIGFLFVKKMLIFQSWNNEDRNKIHVQGKLPHENVYSCTYCMYQKLS